jgi:excisionase family DNA binding protein
MRTRPADKLLLSQREAAELLGVGRGDTLRSLLRRGVLRPVIVDGREYISRDALIELARVGEGPPPPRQRRRTKAALPKSIADLDF